jgi:hypothetical protein
MYGAKARLELLTPTRENGQPGHGVLARVTIPYRAAATPVRHRHPEPVTAR